MTTTKVAKIQEDVSQIVVIGTSAGGLKCINKINFSIKGKFSGTYFSCTAYFSRCDR
ncbi:MAG: hypothetical protein M3512_11705 [Bacteroidota bacterium]|nr:hypothetical protein [Bacteroidota bacterium]MDQ3536636.1 hypothetical protein [Bacteroidota bacterium]